jgi:hypothetical protein
MINITRLNEVHYGLLYSKYKPWILSSFLKHGILIFCRFGNHAFNLAHLNLLWKGFFHNICPYHHMCYPLFNGVSCPLYSCLKKWNMHLFSVLKGNTHVHWWCGAQINNHSIVLIITLQYVPHGSNSCSYVQLSWMQCRLSCNNMMVHCSM